MGNPDRPNFEPKTEKVSIPEEIENQVPYAEVQDVVRALKLEDYEQFEFNNQTHQLIFSEEEQGNPIEFFQSTVLTGCDVYIWESVKTKGEDILRVALAHELAEIAVYDILTIKNKGNTKATSQESHDIALLYEKKYELENISPDRRSECEEAIKGMREKGYLKIFPVVVSQE